ncbi:chromate efflux transporter [bacterium]|nr:chromate efflux transporter [bacterium]
MREKDAQPGIDGRRVRDVALMFLKIGLTSFGGPAAHTGLMHREIVQRRGWLTDGEFLDLLGAANLIPGPNSTEMAIHIGYRRAGWPGLVAAGVCFIVPAMLITMGFGWLYVRYGTLPQAAWLLYGVKPVVMAIIGFALWNLRRAAAKTPSMAAGVAVSCVLSLCGVNELAVLFGCGAVVAVARIAGQRIRGASCAIMPLAAAGISAAGAAPFSSSTLFLTFLKIGAVLYGSGYVLLAFLRGDFVERLGWLTDQQLIDAVAAGQITPGPLFSTAAFVGYVLGGPQAALLATAGIFLPSFVFVALSGPLVARMRSSPLAGALLDGVNAASIGLMLAVAVQLGRASFVDPVTVCAGILCLLLLVRYTLNSAWLIAGGAAAGYAVHWCRGM